MRPVRAHPAARDLLAEVERYLRETGLGPTEFGTRAMRDGNFVQRLRGGRTPTLQTIDRVRAFMTRKPPR
jgi:hypothetical protein